MLSSHAKMLSDDTAPPACCNHSAHNQHAVASKLQHQIVHLLLLKFIQNAAAAAAAVVHATVHATVVYAIVPTAVSLSSDWVSNLPIEHYGASSMITCWWHHGAEM
jgi:hypothetical protein